jgi:glycosyltransferase involved in cell wall biosynthesis
MKFIQLVHTLSYGDAISGEVLSLARCFEELGYESDIYACNISHKHEGKAKRISEFPGNFSGELVLHYSIGSPTNDLYKANSSATRSLIFHNLTPPDWFDGINHRVRDDIREGFDELAPLLQISGRVIADSRFNASELEKLGTKSEVLELPIDPKRWTESTNPGIASLLQQDKSLHLLHVGRLATNKCIEDVLRTFYFLHHFVEKKSKLWIAGIDIDTEIYSFSLKQLARKLNIDHAVEFTGGLADSEIRALYENSSVYLCMSEHEGFCLPLIEAMHFGLPVVAFDSSAVPDTVGDGGIIIREKRYDEIACLIAKLYRDSGLRGELIARGKKRVEDLSYERFVRRVRELFDSEACISSSPERNAGAR